MTSNPNKLYCDNLEHTMIASDCVELVNLVNNIRRFKDSAVFMSYLPLISFVIYEINQYIFKKYSLSLLQGDFGNKIKKARHLFKFLDTQGVYNDRNIERSQNIFIKSRTNLIAKIFQPDMGLYMYNGIPYYDTHCITHIMGIRKIEQLDGQYSPEFGKYIGITMHKLVNMLQIDVPAFQNKISDMENKDFSYIDVKSNRFFKSVFTKEDNIPVNYALNYILTNVYNLLHVLPLFIDQESPFMLKIKYLCLYHFSSYLQRLKNFHYLNLSKQTKDRFVDLESALKQIRLIRNKDLRNVLMHYALSEEIPASDNPPYYDVYKYYLPSFSADELNNQIHRGFTDICTILTMWKQNKSV